jgi:hypothetical protein
MRQVCTDGGGGAGVWYHDNKCDLVDIEDRVPEASEDSTIADADVCVHGIVNVDLIFVEYHDVIGICKFCCAEERELAYPGGDVKFVGWQSYIEWIFGQFGGWDNVAVG